MKPKFIHLMTAVLLLSCNFTAKGQASTKFNLENNFKKEVLTFHRLSNHSLVNSTDIYMIVNVNDSCALTSANGSSAAPDAIHVTIVGDSITGSIDDVLQWQFTHTTEGYIIYPKNSTTTWLYTTNNNNGVRIGKNTAKIWTLDVTDPDKPNYHGFMNNTYSRYMGIYKDQDWRAYTSVNNNIANTQIEIFVLIDTPMPGTVSTPTFDPEAGLYMAPQEVSIICSTEGVIIYYTIDGTDPDSTSTVYNTAINVAEDKTIKAIAYKEGMNPSNIASASYVIINNEPYITATPDSMNGFTYLEEEGPSESQSYILMASDLEGSGNINVSANEYFEISLNNMEFANTLNIPFANGVITDQPVTVYVRMKANLEGDTYEGEITHEGGNAVCNVTVNGEVINTHIPKIINELIPLYMQGINGTNNKRIPFAYTLTLGGLNPNTTYRYINQMVISDDAATAAGVGNIIFVNGNEFFRVTSPSFETEGNYGEFTTDKNGEYTGWFISEATANIRFTPGNHVFMRVRINDGNNGSTAEHYFTSESYATILAFGTENDNLKGTAIYAHSNDDSKNFVFLYDNIQAEGRPLYGTSIETTGIDFADISQYATFYKNNVSGIDGAWGGIIPNINDNGVKYIGIYSNEKGELVNNYISNDGLWGITNTVNPVGSTNEPLYINLIEQNINELYELDVNIWNTRHEIIIENNSGKKLQMTILNVLGQAIIARDNIGQGFQHISHNLNYGTYIIMINNNKLFKSAKIIVK